MIAAKHNARSAPNVAEDSFLPLIRTLQSEIQELRADLDSLRNGQRKPRRDPDLGFVSVRDAAQFCGRSLQGVQSWLKRLARDPDAPPVRRLHGRVHLGDLKRVLESQRIIGQGERVSRALQKGRGMV